MTALDSSVIIPALIHWHAAHEEARSAARGGKAPAHALLESYSVLTRMPSPHTLATDVAARLLSEWFPADRILLPGPSLAVSIVDRLAAAGIPGGASYDGLIGLTAEASGEELLTRDARAAATYERLGVQFRLLGPNGNAPGSGANAR